MSTRYISTADTAKLIRKALKRAFPGQWFYVNSKTYSMGASIDVNWMDGPSEEEVKPITSSFAGAGFDGMIDMKYHIDHWLLPDGSVQVAHNTGSTGSGGVYDPVSNPRPHPDAKWVSFGSDFVFTHRALSPERVREFVAQMVERTGWDPPEIVESDWYVGRGVKGRQAQIQFDFERNWETTEFRRELMATSFYERPAPAPEPDPAPANGNGGSHQVTYDRDWTWIQFGTKPDEAVRTSLKSLGARWSRRRTAWYIRHRVERNVVNAAISGNETSSQAGPTGEDWFLDAHL